MFTPEPSIVEDSTNHQSTRCPMAAWAAKGYGISRMAMNYAWIVLTFRLRNILRHHNTQRTTDKLLIVWSWTSPFRAHYGYHPLQWISGETQRELAQLKRPLQDTNHANGHRGGRASNCVKLIYNDLMVMLCLVFKSIHMPTSFLEFIGIENYSGGQERFSC